MTRGIGTDIVLNARFDERDEKFLRHIFTEKEMRIGQDRLNRSEYYASRFAAKEAVVKALGTGFVGITPLDIEVEEDEKGRPFVSFSRPMGVRILLSLSHEKDYSVAFAVAEDE